MGALAGALVSLAMLPLAARADDLEVGLKATVPAGRRPALLVTVHKPISRLSVHLEPARGRVVRFERTRLPLDEAVELALPAPAGRIAWSGTLAVTFADGTSGELPLSFETVVSAGVHVTSGAKREDVLARKATIRADRPIHHVKVEVFGEGGRRLGGTDEDMKPLPVDEAIPVEWTQAVPGEPLKIVVTVTDDDGMTGGLVWMPWEVRIPHEEVVFDTGEAVIRKDQAPKLEAVLDALNAALEKYGSVVEVRLWVAGHTDTVGRPETNRVLSERRARAIGRWFRTHGVRAPIFYRGLGEAVPAVPTPDGTPEAKNRRAEYVVAGEDPYAGQTLPGAWKPLD